jgi:sugar phosphate permease
VGDTVAFGILSGLATVVPLIVGSIVAGITTDSLNRSLFQNTSSLVWALAMVGTGFSQNFVTVLILRIILGFA